MKILRTLLLGIMITLLLVLSESETAFSESASLTTTIQVRVVLPPNYYADKKEAKKDILPEKHKNEFSKMDIMRVDEITKGTRVVTVYTICPNL